MLPLVLSGQTYGLQFTGHELPLNERTELYLTPDKPLYFENTLDLSFEFRLQPNAISYFGYVYRMVIGSQSIDFLHGLIPGNINNFQLVFNDTPSMITFPVPLDSLTGGWTKFHFRLNIDEGTITCSLKDTVFTGQLKGYEASEGVRLFFGAHEYGNFTTTDVTQMNIRDVRLKADQKTYSWPMKQGEGEVVEEVNHHKDGLVKNPNWLLTMHTDWRKIAGFELSGVAQAAFNQQEDLLYIATSSSIMTMNLTDNSISEQMYTTPYQVVSINNLMFDSVAGQLISYSIDQNYKSVYDPFVRAWSIYPRDTVSLTRYWHHNSFIHPDGSLYTFGGYGQFYYKNLVLHMSPGAVTFDTVPFTGEFFPRYLAAIGYSEKTDRLYILGGYGSKTGQQTLSPGYYYELLVYSFADSSFSRIYECEESGEDFCFANSAVIVDNQLYALAFSKYKFDNQLQLIRIDLDDPSIEKLGTPIDFSFIDIQSNVNLYYSSVSGKLITTTSYLKDGKTSLDVFSISFPPEEAPAAIMDSIPGAGKNGNIVLYIVVPVLLLTAMAGWYLFRNRKMRTTENGTGEQVRTSDQARVENHRQEPLKSSIILFGGFQVIDKEGNDITGSFTQLLKKLLLFIMLNSLRYDKGVSSHIISETFWFDKSTESARNNRAVNIVKIKSLLEKVGEATISKDTGYWKFEYDPRTMHIDYADYLGIVKRDEALKRDDILRLLRIIDRGQFLVNTDADWLDVFKSEVSNNIIDTLADYTEVSENEPDFILHLTNCMFTFDIASEEAMILQVRTLFKLGKHSLAKKSYAKFIKEYKTLYDEDYKRSFSSIIEAGREAGK
jgi:two-component SAPR family response regulator